MDFSGAGSPIVGSLLDTDLYKLLMLQLIWRDFRDVPVTFSLVNRTRKVRIADEIPLEALRAELDHVRALRFTPDEIAWLRTAQIYGRTDRFAPAFLDWLAELRLPQPQVEAREGQLELTFSGPWSEVTLWEIPALVIVSNLRAQAAVGRMSPAEREVLYACAIGRLEEKAGRLAALPDLVLTDFGTRRRHSFAWQKQCLQVFAERLGARFPGTSNIRLARELGLAPAGTNGHEVPMVIAAMAQDDPALARAPYRALEAWAELYDQPLRILLPDTFGSEAFFRNAPDWAADWRGVRPDSAPPIESGEAILDWWRARGRDPRDKLLIFSDALDLPAILTLYERFNGRVGLGFGWGTKLTNDLEGCSEAPGLHPISLVCKVTEAAGRPAVKLSDNPEKATGERAEIERYLQVFGGAGQVSRPVAV